MQFIHAWPEYTSSIISKIIKTKIDLDISDFVLKMSGWYNCPNDKNEEKKLH